MHTRIGPCSGPIARLSFTAAVSTDTSRNSGRQPAAKPAGERGSAWMAVIFSFTSAGALHACMHWHRLSAQTGTGKLETCPVNKGIVHDSYEELKTRSCHPRATGRCGLRNDHGCDSRRSLFRRDGVDRSFSRRRAGSQPHAGPRSPQAAGGGGPRGTDDEPPVAGGLPDGGARARNL